MLQEIGDTCGRLHLIKEGIWLADCDRTQPALARLGIFVQADTA